MLLNGHGPRRAKTDIGDRAGAEVGDGCHPIGIKRPSRVGRAAAGYPLTAGYPRSGSRRRGCWRAAGTYDHLSGAELGDRHVCSWRTSSAVGLAASWRHERLGSSERGVHPARGRWTGFSASAPWRLRKQPKKSGSLWTRRATRRSSGARPEGPLGSPARSRRRPLGLRPPRARRECEIDRERARPDEDSGVVDTFDPRTAPRAPRGALGPRSSSW